MLAPRREASAVDLQLNSHLHSSSRHKANNSSKHHQKKTECAFPLSWLRKFEEGVYFAKHLYMCGNKCLMLAFDSFGGVLMRMRLYND